MRQLIFLTLILSAGLPGNAGAQDIQTHQSGSLATLWGDAFGTTFTVKVHVPPGEEFPQSLKQDITAVIDRLNTQMSLWDDQSELSRFNRHLGDEWVAVSEDVVTVVEAALEVRQSTGGAFDPTVRPLLSLWSFGPGARPHQVPSDKDVLAAQSLVGAVIETRREPEPALRKANSHAELDLNAIAKGYAVDVIAGLVDSHEPVGFMVEIGGEVRTKGTKPGGDPWRIAIERPVTETRVIEAAIDLQDAALATSGDYRNYFEADGQRFSHTIDPRTGRPITHALASVSVIAHDGMTADAWATALMVLGPDEGYTLADQENIAAMFLIREGNGFLTRTTAGFPDLIALGPPMTVDSPWSTFLLAAIVFGVALGGMAIGVILAGRRLRGSCGGLSGLKDEKGNPLCDACTNPEEKCEEFRKQVAAASTKDSK